MGTNANRDTIVALFPAVIVPLLVSLFLTGVGRYLAWGIGAVALFAVVGLFIQGAMVSARRASKQSS